jgi:hypothetical protein
MKRGLRGLMASAILAAAFGEAEVISRKPTTQSPADKVAAIDAANAKRARRNAKRMREAGK